MGARTLLLGAIAIVLFGAFITPVNDPDFWWHIATGRWMLDHHVLPARDLFTYTAPNHAWTDHEWLSEVLMALIWQAGGSTAISLVFGIVTWLGFWWIFQAYDGLRRPYVIAGLGVAFAAVAGGPIWGPRAQMITFALSCLQLLWIRRYLQGRSRAILWLPLVMVLWANLHSGWAIAFFILGIALVAEAMLWVWNREYEHRAHLRTLGIVTLLSLVAVAATPHGLALYAYPFQTQFSTAQQSLIAEWFSPDFHQSYLYALLALICLLLAFYAWRRPCLYDVLLAMVLLALSLHSVRQSTIFIAAVMPGFVAACSDGWEELRRQLLGGLFAPGRAAPGSPLLAAVTVLFLLAVATGTGLKIASGVKREGQAIAADFPVATADWIAAHPNQIGTRMFNQYGWGGYLIYRFYPDPRRRVFIFGEAALMGDDFLYRYQDIQTLRPNWQQLLDHYQVDYVVYNRGQALDNVLRTEPGWRLVHQDSVAVVYVRVPRSNTAAPGS